MKFKIGLITGFILIPAFVFAQFTDKNLQAMIDTERAFALTAKEKNTHDAFMYFLSDEAVTAGPYGPVVGKSELKKQKPDDSLLSWDIAYCDIASSGDFGYNTGPWEFRTNKSDESPVAYGEYHSVWRKQTDGKWKNVADIGIQHDAPLSKEELKTTKKPLKPQGKSTATHEAIISLMAKEKAFLEAFAKSGSEVYKVFGSDELRISREGRLPIITPADKAAFIKEPNHYANVALSDGGIASSGDMGFMYGTADIPVLKDDKWETKRATYLRIWKKEELKDWKVVLDVMSYR